MTPRPAFPLHRPPRRGRAPGLALAALAVGLGLALGCGAAAAQTLETRFSCSTERNDGERIILADNGEFRLNGERIETIHWESALYRATHGFDCSIDESDGPLAELLEGGKTARWRIRLDDAPAARARRGFTFERLPNCTIRLERDGEMLHIRPSCPALCGSRGNFSELSVNIKTGECRYEE